MKRVKIYLDSVIVIGIENRDLGSEMDATDQLVSLGKRDEIKIVTSRQLPRSMEKTKNKEERELRIQSSINFTMVPRDHRVLGFHYQSDQYGGCAPSPLVTDIVDENMFSELIGFGLKDDDAKHFMYAFCNGCNYFVSVDQHFINRRGKIASRYPQIRIMKPSELVDHLNQL